jgi:YL1 nuclear protein C-terminal domain
MSQRKAWNEAMRSAAGAQALPPGLQAKNTKRRSDRKKQGRRDKARKVVGIGGPESKEILAAAWMDALEDIQATGALGGEDDDSYDELDELENEGKKRNRRGSSKKAEAGTMPKRFKPRSVASILTEEFSRFDGVAKQWLDSEARSRRPPLPARKFCPVTGMEGIYTEPKTGIPYANLKALEQINERPPPWMTLVGSLAYHECVKSIRDEEF